MAHDQSIIQALSIFHLQERTKKAKRHTTIHTGKDGLNMEVEGSYLSYFSCFFFYWFLINGIL